LNSSILSLPYMNTVRTSRTLILCLLITGVVVLDSTQARQRNNAPLTDRKPNIVYILADDLGWGDARVYNLQSQVPTPNIDRLASQGMRFTDMHSPSSVCTPTRYGILTGRYSWRTRLKSGVLNGRSPNLVEPGRLTVASMLKAQGYFAAGIGKWHLGLGSQSQTDYNERFDLNPTSHGFDYYFGIPASLDMEPYLFFENDHALEKPTSQIKGSDTPRGVYWREGAIAPGFTLEEVLPTLTDKGVALLRERAAKASQPFFLYLPLTGPHTPWLPTRKFRGSSNAGDYGDFVAQVDDAVGQVMRALDGTGLAENTLLIFTSDNGAHWKPEDKAAFPHLANAGWRGMKADTWEAGHRIPFIARWPGRIRAGVVSNELGCLTDFLATAAEIVGTKLPADAGEDSYSLLPALLAKSDKKGKPIREAIVHHSTDGMFAIRQGEWKLILGLGSGGFSDPRRAEQKAGEAAGQLYNLAKDPAEENNLYQQEPQIVARLSALLEKYKQQGYSRLR
jgi:arylsulfatase A-like enzyme